MLGASLCIYWDSEPQKFELTGQEEAVSFFVGGTNFLLGCHDNDMLLALLKRAISRLCYCGIELYNEDLASL